MFAWSDIAEIVMSIISYFIFPCWQSWFCIVNVMVVDALAPCQGVSTYEIDYVEQISYCLARGKILNICVMLAMRNEIIHINILCLLWKNKACNGWKAPIILHGNNNPSILPLFIANVMFADDFVTRTRAPSQYKDRLIYVWQFPC